MRDQEPVDREFPISTVNLIAERQAHADRDTCLVYTMHQWWASRLGSVFRTSVLYALTYEEARERAEAETHSCDLLSFEKGEAERLWDLCPTDAPVGAGQSCWSR